MLLSPSLVASRVKGSALRRERHSRTGLRCSFSVEYCHQFVHQFAFLCEILCLLYVHRSASRKIPADRAFSDASCVRRVPQSLHRLTSLASRNGPLASIVNVSVTMFSVSVGCNDVNCRRVPKLDAIVAFAPHQRLCTVSACFLALLSTSSCSMSILVICARKDPRLSCLGLVCWPGTAFPTISSTWSYMQSVAVFPGMDPCFSIKRCILSSV